MRKGLIQVYTGNGRGKTTAATGQIIRAVGRDFRVMVVYWLKEDNSSGEMSMLKKLGVKTFFWGGIYGKKLAQDKTIQEKQKIQENCAHFLDQVKAEIEKQRYDLLVFDEINIALQCGLMEKEKFFDFLRDKPVSLEIILTGRRAPQDIIDIADLVTEMREIKHPYKQGIKMRKGIDY